MAHFAELDENNMVTRVIVVNNLELLDENGQEQEFIGINFCKSLLGGNWIQTSYNGNFRVRFAGYRYTYDENHDAFIAPKPFASWLFNDNSLDWYAPVPYPEDGNYYEWNEETLSWQQIIIEYPIPE